MGFNNQHRMVRHLDKKANISIWENMEVRDKEAAKGKEAVITNLHQ